MKQVAIIFSILYLTFGCTETSKNDHIYKRKNTLPNSSKILCIPEINLEVTRKTGEELISNSFLLINRTALHIKKDVSKPFFISAGFYIQDYEDENMYYFKHSRQVPLDGMIFDLSYDENKEEYKYFFIKKVDDGNLYIKPFFGATKLVRAEYERKNIDLHKANKFSQTLVFSGLVGNKLKIGYREFSEGRARPAFNNDAEYDLSTSMTIGYKGCKIEVIKADNESITYKVLKNFD